MCWVPLWINVKTFSVHDKSLLLITHSPCWNRITFIVASCARIENTKKIWVTKTTSALPCDFLVKSGAYKAALPKVMVTTVCGQKHRSRRLCKVNTELLSENGTASVNDQCDLTSQPDNMMWLLVYKLFEYLSRVCSWFWNSSWIH